MRLRPRGRSGRKPPAVFFGPGESRPAVLDGGVLRQAIAGEQSAESDERRRAVRRRPERQVDADRGGGRQHGRGQGAPRQARAERRRSIDLVHLVFPPRSTRRFSRSAGALSSVQSIARAEHRRDEEVEADCSHERSPASAFGLPRRLSAVAESGAWLFRDRIPEWSAGRLSYALLNKALPIVKMGKFLPLQQYRRNASTAAAGRTSLADSARRHDRT